MKDCNWNYPIWGIDQEYINSDRTPIPNPICGWCQYLQACKLRVEILLNTGIEMQEEDIETIRWLSEAHGVYEAYPELRTVN